MSPFAFARACTKRHIIFMAVSGAMSLASHTPLIGGEGIAFWSSGDDIGGISPVSSDGFGGEGGCSGGVMLRLLMMESAKARWVT